MPFILKKFDASNNKKIQLFLIQDLNFTPKQTNRLISKKRVFDSSNIPYLMSQEIKEKHIFIAVFQGHTRGLKPLLTFKDFAIFDKPSNLMIHPNSKNTKYSLLDEIRYHFGNKANQVHRIDAETSGLVLIGLNKKATTTLASMFEEKKYKKSYLAIVKGEIKTELTINKNLKKEGKTIGVKMSVCSENEGKESISHIKPIKYNKKKNLSLIQINPITGRQHQIRVHLYSIKHRILGDPIYGVNTNITEAYLNKTLKEDDRKKTIGSHRLWLQANYLQFDYEGITYKIYSKNEDIIKEFES